MNKKSSTLIPTRTIGPIKIVGSICNAEVFVPMATYETTLWPSTARGAKISRLAGGIYVGVLQDIMTRSIVMQAADAAAASKFIKYLNNHAADIKSVVEQQSRFAKLDNLQIEQIGRLIYIRIAIQSGDASGHNMSTKAADAIIGWIMQQQPQIEYVSISANYCTDKKVSAVNGICGRGKRVVCEINISREICQKHLRITPERMVDLHIKKNLIGSNLAGSLRSANSHVANILLATYLPTGQDAANIIEGSQSIVHAEYDADNLYFSLTLPNLIVGTVGNGKHHGAVKENLELLGCTPESSGSAKKLAAIIGATALCGELSCLAAQCNLGELTRSHMHFERQHRHICKGEGSDS